MHESARRFDRSAQRNAARQRDGERGREHTARAAHLHRDARRYALMPELGTRPRNVFLVKVRNPNPELESKAEAAKLKN